MFQPVRIRRHASGTAKDREALDFSRYMSHYFAGCQPQMGISYAQLLEIASNTLGYVIRDVSEIRTKAEFKRVHRALYQIKKGGMNGGR